MNPPALAPSEANLSEWREYALGYLAAQLRERAPKSLGEGRVFAVSPLEGEGATVIFQFSSAASPPSDTACFVVVGRTEPNYYPAYGLTPEEAFHLHLGTRFMLVMGVALRAPTKEDDFDIQREARLIVDRVAPGASLENLSLAASFDVDGKLHAVLKCRIGDIETYIMAGAAPHGFSRQTHLPPQIAYRIHIGHVLCMEPRPDGES